MSDFWDAVLLALPGLPADVSLGARVRKVTKILLPKYPQTYIHTGVERDSHWIVITKDNREVWVFITEQLQPDDLNRAKNILHNENDPHFGILLVSTSGVIIPEVNHSARETKIQISKEKTPEKIAERILRMLESMRPNRIYSRSEN